MTEPRRPAAYVRVGQGSGAWALARLHRAVAESARMHGWPAPAVYADEDGAGPAGSGGPALMMLSAAIGTGRHDAVLIAGTGGSSPAYLMRFLFHCTRHGVAVEFASPSEAVNGFVMAPPRAAEHPPPFPLPRAAGTVLARAGLEALSGVFPDWRIWSDDHGWHGRRRGGGYVQGYRRGAPVFCVHAGNLVDLAAQLCWQRAADVHAPSGCSAG